MEPKKQYLEILYVVWNNITDLELFTNGQRCSSEEIWLCIWSQEKEPGYTRLVQLSQFRRLTTPKRWIKWVLALIRMFEKGSK